MRKTCIILFSLLISVLTAKSQTQNQDKTRVLFIGNSITYFNNMPQTFEAIANSKKDYTDVTVYAPGGTGFIHHVNDPNVYEYFRKGNWDYVVLQPGSNESPGYSEPIEATLSRAKILKDSIQAYNPCAKTLYYEISYGVWGSTASDLVTYNNTMDLIRANIEYLSDSTSLFFAPAGEAVRIAWNADQTTMLWGSTGDIHPNAKGSYIIACTFYASIFKKPSLGTDVIHTLTQQEAEKYQLLADTTVLNHLSNWRINTYNQYTNFEYVKNQLSVDFMSTSQHVDALFWDFGDGHTSENVSEISHTYENAGNYNVTLTSYKGECSETIRKTTHVEPIEIEDVNNTTSFHIYPNPFTNKIIIEHYTTTDISIYDVLGKDFTPSISINRNNSGIEIQTQKLPKGLYLLKTPSFVKVLWKQ